jgi:hypothetical protein
MQRSKGMTPRARRDDEHRPWIDDPPVRRLWMVERERLRRLQRIADACGRDERYTANSGSGTPVTLYPIKGGKPMPFPSLKTAAQFVGVDDSNLGQRLKRENYRIGGYLWEVKGGGVR